MVIAQTLLRGGLLTLAFTSATATAKAVCRIMRSPSLRDAETQRTRSEYDERPEHVEPSARVAVSEAEQSTKCSRE
jgi:hypothetical protein